MTEQNQAEALDQWRWEMALQFASREADIGGPSLNMLAMLEYRRLVREDVRPEKHDDDGYFADRARAASPGAAGRQNREQGGRSMTKAEITEADRLAAEALSYLACDGGDKAHIEEVLARHRQQAVAEALTVREAEIERLREALREIADTPNAGWMIARAALQETK